MVRVYTADLDVNNYQRFEFEDIKVFDQAILDRSFDFDGRPRADSWVPAVMRRSRSRLKEGDFWALEMTAGVWATRPEATHALEPLLRLAGEILPLPYRGETFSVLNITQFSQSLDDRTEWDVTSDTGKPFAIRAYAFDPNRFGESSLFKLRETNGAYIYCYEGVNDPQDEFKATVERLGLTGMKFHLIWSDSGEPIPERPLW